MESSGHCNTPGCHPNCANVTRVLRIFVSGGSASWSSSWQSTASSSGGALSIPRRQSRFGKPFGKYMKISRIETIPIRVPIKPELAIKSGRGGSHAVSPFLVVKLRTDDGLVGLGEVSCTPRWSGEDQVTAGHFIETYFAPLLVGESLRELRDIERLTTKFTFPVAGNLFTKAGVEMALCDLLGKLLDKPVYELLGGKVRDFVPTKWSVSGVEPQRAAEIARGAASRGFTAMKVKVGTDSDADVARARAVRDGVGPQTNLGVAGSGSGPTARTVATARKKCRE